MKLWVDDERFPPGPDWTWCKSSEDALLLLEAHRVAEMSLDHDLGGEDTTRAIIMWLCAQGALGHDYWPTTVRVHSANPVGRDWLEGMIGRYKP